MSTAAQVQTLPKVKLIVVSGPHNGQEYIFHRESITIGRDENNTVPLIKDLRVSRNHAELKWKGDGFFLTNLSSKNFILVNGEKVDSAPITHKSRIQVGESDIVVKIPDLESLTVAGTTSSNVMPLQRPTGQQSPSAAGALTPTNSGAKGIANRPHGIPAQKNSQPLATHSARPGTPALRKNEGGLAPGGATAPSTLSPGARRYQQQRQAKTSAPTDPGKSRFYIILGVVILIGGFFLFSNSKPKTPPKPFRSNRQIEFETDQSKKSTEELKEALAKADTVQSRRAQENLLKGLRDFQQGQYARAKEAFQVVLNLDPENQLAQRYYHLARLKFEDFVKWNLMQGQRYREKRNWRLCRSNFFSVMVMLQNNREDPMYREAKQFHDECALQLEGRY